MEAPLRLAIIGTRGIPANYGGFETLAQELSTRLVARGHEVTVYGRSHHVPAGLEQVDGVRIRRLWSVRQKYLETPSNTLLAMVDAVLRSYDVLLVCNAANAFACVLPRLAKTPVALNVDGLEWQRRKWNRLGRWVYRTSERLTPKVATRIVSDSRTIQQYYREKRGVDSCFIPYGAPLGRVKSHAAVDQLEIESGRYFLYVSRLEPENNAHLVIEAYLEAAVSIPLVIVGDAPYSRPYIDQLGVLAAAGDVRLVGAHYGVAYRELLSHCHTYFQATEVGGTHPALVEAMGTGCVVVAHDTPENREVLSDTGVLKDFYDRPRLAALMRQLTDQPAQFDGLGARALRRVQKHYSWERVTDAYEQLFVEMAADSLAPRSWRAGSVDGKGGQRT